METRFFSTKSQIDKFLSNHNEHQRYAILNITSFWWFWKRFEVLFYNNDDIVSHLLVAARDLIEEEIAIEIKDINIQVYPPSEIEITINSNKNKLLFGRLGQNQNALELFFARTASYQFRTKYNVKLRISNADRAAYLRSQPNHSASENDERSSRFAMSPTKKHSFRRFSPIRENLSEMIKKSEEQCLNGDVPFKISSLNGGERKLFHEHFRNHKQIKCFSEGSGPNRVLVLELITSAAKV